MMTTGTNYNPKLTPTLESIDLDLDIYRNIFTGSQRFKEHVQEAASFFEEAPSLFADIYLALFKESPVQEPADPGNKDRLIQHGFMKHLMALDVFQALKNSCTLSYFNSILATELLGNELIEQLIKRSKSDSCIPSRLALLNMEVRDFLNHLSDQHYFYGCVSEAQAEFNRLTYTIKAWGLDDGTLTPTSYEDKISVSLQLRTNKKVRDIAEMAGRFKATANSIQKRRTKEEGIEICGVHLGSELHKTLPSERMLLVNDATKRYFFKKLSHRELLSYKYKNSRSKSKGPIICCIDTSASMTGEREIWSKAVALTLLEIAYQQKRGFAAILYSNKVYHIIEFRKKKREPQKVYDLATFFYGSGTNFVEPLRESLKLIRTNTYKYADIVFITDGKASIDEAFIDSFNLVKEKKEFRMITVNVSDELEEALDQLNDTQILLKNLTQKNIEEANDVIFAL